jgi:hypothetical protein
MNPNRIEVPPRAGRIVFQGRTEAKFWAKALAIEGEVEQALKLLDADNRRVRAAVPVIAEYKVSEEFIFIYVMVLDVDSLGITGGQGVIFYADSAYQAEAFQRRDKFADDLMEELQKRGGYDEMIEVPEKKEL